MACQACVRIGEDLHKIVGAKAREFDTNGKSPLQFGYQIGGLGEMKCAAGDKQDMIGFDHAIFG